MFRREARGEKSVKIGEQNLLLPLFSARPGEEERLQSRSKRHHFKLFFFNEQCMKWRRFGPNASFHLKGNGGKILSKSKSVLNLCFV